MKKKLLFIMSAALLSGSNVMAEEEPQIPNGDFETWTYDGDNLPNNWNSFQTASGASVPFIGNLASMAYDSNNRQVKQSTDTRPGSTGQYSCSIWSRTVLGSIVAQGNLTTGRVYAGAMSAADKNNYNYTDLTGAKSANGKSGEPCAIPFTGKPKAVKVWVKYVQGGSGYGEYNKAKFSAVIHDNGDYISYGLPEYDNNTNKALVVASAVKEIEYTGGDWVELTLPFEYTNNDAKPVYILINASTNAYPGKGKANDYLYIDDIVMVYTTAADKVVEKIDAIGNVEYTDASKQKIDDARSAYNALTDGEKAQVPDNKLTVLTDAEATYAQLKKEAEDYAAAMVVVEKIQAIGTVEYTEASKQKIDEARAAYDALTDAQKVFADKQGLPILTDAEAAYAQLKQQAEQEAHDQAEKEKQDKAAAAAAIDKINAIGTVEYTDASKQKIDDARAAYNALTNDQKALVSADKLTVLTDAETAYAQLKQQAEQQAEKEKQDKAAADAAVDKINAIGTVEYTDASKQKIDAARAAYDALTDDQKALVSTDKLTVLTDAEAAYAQLKQQAEDQAEKEKQDKAAADAAVDKINAIGTVDYTDASKQKIDAARAAYDALTDDQKALVSADKLTVLTDAETAYAQLKQQAEDQAEKEKQDKAAADAAIEKINAIGTVEYTDASKQKIDDARAAYDALTDDQKALVSADKLTVLTDAETAYAQLKQQAEDQAEKE
ncbi:MAG: PCMD domain-containing protein, partial [Prevotella sp.]|nr:PCMD domain-containing protein [Prevotella sp.]